jgi:hypothetical protein
MWNVTVTRQKQHIYQASHSTLLFLLNSGQDDPRNRK